MRILRPLLLVSALILTPGLASADVSIQVRSPGISIGINIPAYPRLIIVPGYPVYYAPDLAMNYFFYDGLYWVYWSDNWYVSTWYNGPWHLVARIDVPLFILRIPVRYYRQPPVYFRGWFSDEPPHWPDRWGRDWEKRRPDWRNSYIRPAPLPSYQRQYPKNRYPRKEEQRRELEMKKYHYQPRDPAVRRHFDQRTRQAVPQQRQQPRQKQQPRQDDRQDRRDDRRDRR